MKLDFLVSVAFILLLIGLGGTNFESFAQSQDVETPFTVRSGASSCELNSREIDDLLSEARKNGNRIFVISRLGTGESLRMHKIRLEGVRQYIAVRKFPANMLVLASGDQLLAGEQGRLEFYLGDKLFLISEAKINKPVCLTCCESP